MTKTNQLKIVIASDVDYEYLIAEIYCDDEFIALIHQENGLDNLQVEFPGTAISCNLEWLQTALYEAKRKLISS